MKTKLLKPFRFIANRKNSFIPIILFISMIGITTSCQSSFTKGNGETPPKVPGVKVYGKVDSLPHLHDYTPGPLHLAHNAVGIAWHKYPCSDSTSWSDTTGKGFIRNFKVGSDTYDIPITSSKFAIEKPNHPCITIFIEHIYPPTTKNHKAPKGYARILAGPKKLGKDFWSHFHPNSFLHTHYDSVRVDFVVKDSALEKGKILKF